LLSANTKRKFSANEKTKVGGKINILKQNISFPIIYFVISIGWDIITETEINWVENIAVSFIAFLFLLFYDWAKEPYQRKKR